jgi:hypothetical protein
VPTSAQHAAGQTLAAISTLERIVGSVVTQTTADLFTSIAARLPDTLRASIDLLVEVPDGDARSSLFRLKDYPKSANASVIKGDLVRLGLIEQLLAAGTGLDDLDPRIVRQIGELGRRYDAGDLRRFAKPKRDALVACYLTGARKTLLDPIVEMHDLFLIDINRRARHAVEEKRKALQGGPTKGWIAWRGPSRRWSPWMARKPSPSFARHRTLRPWSRPPSLTARRSGWKNAAISTPCSRVTQTCANTCRLSWFCRFRPLPAARFCSKPSRSAARSMPARATA